MREHKKAVSRERLIGISFIDILIQVIFVLFLALGVGYVDPTKLEKIENMEKRLDDICHRINKDSTKPCFDILEKTVAQQKSLLLCIAPKSSNSQTTSAYFKVHSPNAVKFQGFSKEYKNYLRETQQTQKLQKIETIKIGLYQIQSIENTFGFIREKGCYHHISRGWEGAWRANQLGKAFNTLIRLEDILP